MKKQLLLILGLMFTATIFAAPVSKDSAKKNVLSFLQSKKGNKMFATAGMKQAQLTQVDYEVSGDAFYVFNIGNNQGFVITAADDRVETILGYSYEGSFDPNNVPVNMKQWLDLYANQINAVKELNLNTPNRQFAAGDKSSYRHTILPMITAKWNQTSPYNDMCPDFKDGSGRRYTGCVATAMAMVMHFHKWPQGEVHALPGYEFYDDPTLGGNGRNKQMPALKATTFKWDLMMDEYNYNSTKESKQAVAELMLYCGQSMRMGYHPYASGAFTFDIPESLRKDFNYDKGIKYLDKDGIGTYEWEDIVYEELANGRPILYSGASEGAGGHQFVCDGYENEYFHFNWGWGGASDGYFKLTSLNPNQEGQVGGNGLDFSESQQIVIGVQPPVEGTVRPEDHVEVGYLQLTKNFDGDFKKTNVGTLDLSIKTIFGVSAEKDAVLTVGFGLYDANGKLIEVSKRLDHQFITGGYLRDKIVVTSLSLSAQAIAKDGTYYLRPIVKNANGDFEVIKSGDRKYFEVVVKGNDVKVITYPIVKVAFSNVRIDSPVYSQCESSVSATIENLGEDFDGMVYFTKNGSVDTGNYKSIIMRKGEKLDVTVPFITYQFTEQSFGMAVNGSQKSPEVTTSVTKSETKNPSLLIQPATDLLSTGDFIEIPVEIENNGDNNYIAPIRAVLLQKSGTMYKEIKSVFVPVEAVKGSKVNVNVRFDNLEFNKIYYLSFNYYQFGQEKVYGGTYQNGTPKKVFSRYRTADAVSYYDELGNMEYKVLAEGETFELPSNACFVRVPKTIANRTIKPSSNPNCVYKMLPGVSSSAFAGCNIIKNGACMELNLTDANEFYSVEPIMVGKVNLTINVDNNMTTLFFPFVPSSVTCDGVELTRANSVEEMASKDYALLPIVAEDANTIYCDFDPTFVASPSVLVVKKELIGKSLVFSAEKLTVDLTSNIVRGEYFNINASNKKSAYSEGIYGFGIKEFTKTLHSAKPFSIYLTSVLATDVEKVNIVYPDGLLETGIEEVDADMNGKMVNVYTIDGVKVRTVEYGNKMLEGLASGIYIVNGKKFVK